jgi:hypothetical protein
MSENKKGCLFWGCLSIIIIGLIASLCLYLTYKWAKNTAIEYTSATPIELTEIDYTAEESGNINKKIKSFIEGIKDGKSTLKEVFTDREINIFLDSSKDLKELKGKVKLNFVDNKIKGTVNIPLKGVPLVDGRYLAGDAEFKVTCDDGELFVSLKSLLLNGKEVPEDVLASFKGENLAKELYKNPKHAAILKRIQTIRMEDNKLTIEVGAAD